MSYCGADRVDSSRSRSSFAEQVLKLGKDLFDRIQVARVFWQEEQFGPDRTDELADCLAPVAAEVVQDDDVAGSNMQMGAQSGSAGLSPLAQADSGLVITAIQNWLPPRSVLAVPTDCLGQAAVEALLSAPPELALDLGGVDSVAPIVAGAIFNKGYQTAP